MNLFKYALWLIIFLVVGSMFMSNRDTSSTGSSRAETPRRVATETHYSNGRPRMKSTRDLEYTTLNDSSREEVNRRYANDEFPSEVMQYLDNHIPTATGK